MYGLWLTVLFFAISFSLISECWCEKLHAALQFIDADIEHDLPQLVLFIRVIAVRFVDVKILDFSY